MAYKSHRAPFPITYRQRVTGGFVTLFDNRLPSPDDIEIVNYYTAYQCYLLGAIDPTAALTPISSVTFDPPGVPAGTATMIWKQGVKIRLQLDPSLPPTETEIWLQTGSTGPNTYVAPSCSFDYELVITAQQVQAWYEELIPDDSDVIDGTPFPNFGGSAQPDGLPATRGRRYVELVPESLITGSFGGLYQQILYEASQWTGYEVPWGWLTALYALGGGGGTGTIDAPLKVQNILVTSPYDRTYPASSARYCRARADIGAHLEAHADPAPVQFIEGLAFYAQYLPREYSFDLNLYSIGGSYSGAQNARLDWENGEDPETVALNPAWTGTRKQETYACQSILDGISNTKAKDQRRPVRVWLEPSGEDGRDWRMQWQTHPWSALALSHDLNKAVSAGKTLTSSDASITLTESNWEAYRYLEFEATPDGFSDRDLTLTVGSKSYLFHVGSGLTTVRIDLRSPSNLPSGFTKDSRQARYPLEITSGPYSPSAGRPKIDTGDETDGWLWGLLDRPTSVSVSGLIEGEELDVTALTLTRQASPEVRVMLPFRRETLGWTSETDNTYLDQDLHLWVEGKNAADWPGRAHVVPFSGSPSFTYYSLNTVQGFIASQPGFHATVQTGPSHSPYVPGDPTAKLVSGGLPLGHLDPVVWAPSLGWVDQRSLNLPVTLKGCLKIDESDDYPTAGDERLSYDPATNATIPLRSAKVLRGQASALALKSTNGRPWSGARIEAVKESDLTTSGGYGTADVRGNVRTGTPCGTGNVSYRTRLASGDPVGRPYKTATWANRYDYRIAFRHAPGPPGSVHFYRTSPDLTHYRGYVEGGTLWLGTAPNIDPSDFTDRDTGVTADWVDGCVDRVGQDKRLYVTYGDGTDVFLTHLDEDEGDLSLPISLGAGFTGEPIYTDDNTLWVYRNDGGTVKYHVFDADLNEIDSGDTSLTGIDDDQPISVDDSLKGENGWRLTLFHSVGGTKTIASSDDGINFS